MFQVPQQRAGNHLVIKCEAGHIYVSLPNMICCIFVVLASGQTEGREGTARLKLIKGLKFSLDNLRIEF